MTMTAQHINPTAFFCEIDDNEGDVNEGIIIIKLLQQMLIEDECDESSRYY